MSKIHTNLIKKCLLELCKIPKTRAWQSDTGIARSMDGQRIIKFGLKGSSDIIGVSNGRMICLEIKIGKDKQRPEQVAFQSMIEMCDGFYFIVKDEDDLSLVINKLNKHSSFWKILREIIARFIK